MKKVPGIILRTFTALLIALSFLPLNALAQTASESLEPVTVVGSIADVKVDLKNPLPTTNYSIQIGITTDAGTTCIPQSALVKVFGINQTGTLDYPNIPLAFGTTYCVGVGKNAGTSAGGITYFSGAGNTFSGPGSTSVTATPSSTANSTTNAYGCTTSGTGTYCMLAPLPGIGTLDASGNPTGSIDVGSGIGSYLNGIIRLVLGLIGVLSVAMIVFGGIEYMMGTSIGEKEGGKTRIVNALFGLALALASYIILNTINPNLVNITIGVPQATLTLGENQGVESNETGPAPAAPPSTTGITVPTGTAQSLAQQILQNSAITLDGQWGQNDAASTPLQNIQDTANGKTASTSQAASSQLGGVRQVALSANMLAGMLAVAQVNPITITAIVGSVHSGPSSKHYAGRAFDIQADQSDQASSLPLDKKLADACTVAGASLVITPCAGNYGSSMCAATGYATNTGHKTHIHCEWPS